MKRYLPILILISIILAGIIPYINSLNNPFIWDEEEIIVKNPIIKEWRYLPFLFKTDIFGVQIKPGGFYRPLYIFSFMLDYHIWGLNSVGYHLFSVLVHILNALLLYILILKLCLERKVAWLAGLVFVLFPVNCEAVTLIAARVELILAFLWLLCIMSFLKAVKEGTWFYFLGTAGLFILAIFTKESALLLPFLALIYVFIFLEKGTRQRAILPLLILIGISLIYCGARLLFLGSPFHATLSMINEASFLERVYTFPRILLTYLRLLVFPVGLRSEYHFVVHTFRDIYVWLGVPFLILLGVAVYRFLRPRKQVLFFSSWFLIGILPYCNVVIPLHATLMEHWAYFSSMAFAALMSMAIFRISERITSQRIKYIGVAALVVLVPLYIGKIIERNKEWRDPFVLYQGDLEKEPNSFLLHCNLGVEYFRKGMMEEAKKEFIASIEVCPGKGYDIAYNNLGVIYAREGNVSQAMSCYKKSIDLNNYALAYQNLGALYNNLGMHREAALVLKKGVGLYPLDIEINYQLGIAYYKIGQMQLARQAFEQVRDIGEDYLQTELFLSLLSPK